MRLSNLLFLSVLGVTFVSCNTDNNDFNLPPDWGQIPGGEGGIPGQDDGDTPQFNREIKPYAGQLADDAAKDIVGTDADIYWEANKWTNKVTVIYNDGSATVQTDNADIIYHTEGAHVVIDMQTNTVSNVEISISGQSADGSLKVYSEKKFMLTLDGVELTSSRGSAINSQCKKRVFVNLAEGKRNLLTDNAAYTDDIWYPADTAAADEDRKGCFFSEGNLIFSGTGSLEIAGKTKHGLCSDGYMYVRPGVTIAVTEAVKNAIHIKGDKDDQTGITVAGGLIYAYAAGEAGKCMKTDYNVEISGGDLQLYTSGNAIYDAEEKDTSSAAGIKADGNITVSGGKIEILSTGTGGKGINGDAELKVTGGEITTVTTGGKFVYNSALDLDSSPKGIKAEGDITLENGKVNISVTGVSDGSEGLESKSTITVNGGELFVYAYDDAINAANAITVNGGKVYAYAINNDGIDSNGYLTINGGLVIANGAGAPEEAFDCDRSDRFIVNGGTLVGVAGASIAPSSTSTQKTVIYNGVAMKKDTNLSILDSDGKPVMTYNVPRSLNGSLFFSSPLLTEGGKFELSDGGSISGASESWLGYSTGGTWTEGNAIGSFTVSGVVTTIGQSSGPGGGFPGGNRPGHW